MVEGDVNTARVHELEARAKLWATIASAVQRLVDLGIDVLRQDQAAAQERRDRARR